MEEASISASSSPILRVENLTVRFGGVVALDGVSFDVPAGGICGLIGPNGAGKTTLFNCISRLYQPAAGRILFRGRDLLDAAPHAIATQGISRTFQNLGLFPTMSVLENTMMGAYHRRRTSFTACSLGLPAVRRDERSLRASAERVLEHLGLSAVAGHPAAGLPYGTLKRIELARAVVGRPALVMLDEPAGGLTRAEVDVLAAAIRRLRDDFGLTILLVEHHMAMVMSISETVVVLDMGRVIAEGTPERVANDPAVIEAYLGVGE